LAVCLYQVDTVYQESPQPFDREEAQWLRKVNNKEARSRKEDFIITAFRPTNRKIRTSTKFVKFKRRTVIHMSPGGPRLLKREAKVIGR
jgi:hypothetical protein